MTNEPILIITIIFQLFEIIRQFVVLIETTAYNIDNAGVCID